MKAIILARVSSKEQEDNNSIPSQVRRLNEYAIRFGLDIIDTYQLVESSTKTNRTKFNELITRIKKSEETIALVTDTIDRLQRSFKDSVILDELRLQGKLELRFMREGLIVNKDSNSSDILRWDMGVMFAKSWVNQLGDNVKRGNEQKRQNGEWCGRAPYGYLNIENFGGRKGIEADEATKHVVYDMYTWYASGSFSFLQIRKRLISEYRITIATSQIDRILKNPFYYGTMKIKDKLYKHIYEPIITKKLFDEVQSIKAGANKKPYKYAGLPYYYRGLIICGECGCRITPEKSKGHIYYHCTQYRGKHGASYVREEELTKQLLGAFRAIQPSQEQFNDVIASLKLSNEDKTKYRKRQESTLHSEISKLESRKERLFDIYMDDSVDKETYEKKLAEINESRSNAQSRLSNLNDASDNFYSTLESIMNIVRDAPQTFESSKIQSRRELVQLVLQNLTLEGNQLRWEYKKPFDTMHQTAKNETWLGLVDAFQEELEIYTPSFASINA